MDVRPSPERKFAADYLRMMLFQLRLPSLSIDILKFKAVRREIEIEAREGKEENYVQNAMCMGHLIFCVKNMISERMTSTSENVGAKGGDLWLLYSWREGLSSLFIGEGIREPRQER